MDIWNNKERKVRCIDNSDDTWGVGGTGHLLSVGKEYTVIDVEVHGWHTRVYLKEFPDVEFNSVLFTEIDDYERIIDKLNSIPNIHPIYADEFPWGPSCDKCPNSSKNGGSDICNCTLGLPKFR